MYIKQKNISENKIIVQTFFVKIIYKYLYMLIDLNASLIKTSIK